jgi:hypothetical protein
MNPTEIRNTNWYQLRETLSGRLQAVYTAWITHGPATTRQLAGLSNIDILNVRPRTTDLVSLGLVECIGTVDGQGVYRARSQEQWQTWHDAHLASLASGQQLLL